MSHFDEMKYSIICKWVSDYKTARSNCFWVWILKKIFGEKFTELQINFNLQYQAVAKFVYKSYISYSHRTNVQISLRIFPALSEFKSYWFFQLTKQSRTILYVLKLAIYNSTAWFPSYEFYKTTSLHYFVLFTPEKLLAHRMEFVTFTVYPINMPLHFEPTVIFLEEKSKVLEIDLDFTSLSRQNSSPNGTIRILLVRILTYFAILWDLPTKVESCTVYRSTNNNAVPFCMF